MAEAIPPCINLIILGFVANLSIGGLFMAGLVPAALMALALIAVAIIFGVRTQTEGEVTAPIPMSQLWGGAAATVGLIVLIFGGFKSGFATATEISAFAALYALVVGGVVFRELGLAGGGAQLHAGRDPLRPDHVHRGGGAVARLCADLAADPAHARRRADPSVAVGRHLAVHAAVDRHPDRDGLGAGRRGGADHLRPAAGAGRRDARHRAVAFRRGAGGRDGHRLFAPPLGLGLYGACLVGNVPIEETVKPIFGYLGLLLICLLVIAFVPALTLWLPHALGY